jgi:hypothetical protein
MDVAGGALPCSEDLLDPDESHADHRRSMPAAVDATLLASPNVG